jgi:hypothetical protein
MSKQKELRPALVQPWFSLSSSSTLMIGMMKAIAIENEIQL